MKKRKILYISMSIPYDNVPHAGGKTFNYYINGFANDIDNEVTMIAKVLPEEEHQIENINPNINTIIVRTPKNKVKKYISYIKSLNSKINPLYRYGNVLTKEIFNQIGNELDKLKNTGYVPDIVILEWTWMLLFIDQVKKRFPNAKYIASEHDVSFLGAQRQYENAKGFKKIYKKLYYNNLYEREILSINKCDYVVTHNAKDKKLLLKNGVEQSKLGVIVPYINLPEQVARKNINKNILFYGAMNRIENEISAEWFIKNVMPEIKDTGAKYVIVGNKPSDELKKYESDNVIITGFVQDIQPYFSSAMCLAAPIQAGAGVKVKILEAMAMGVPVLTNNIGIEGIEVDDGIHYYHCETPEDYNGKIRYIIQNRDEAEKVAQNALKFINDNYNLKNSFKEYSEKIYSL